MINTEIMSNPDVLVALKATAIADLVKFNEIGDALVQSHNEYMSIKKGGNNHKTALEVHLKIKAAHDAAGKACSVSAKASWDAFYADYMLEKANGSGGDD